MSDLTTLVCLFHHRTQAEAAVHDLREAGIADSAVSTIDGADALEKSQLASLGMPDRDYDHLKGALADGGIVISVSAIEDHAATVERIFGKHQAEKIDETEATAPAALPLAAPVAAAGLEQPIPVIEENLVVGKRTVDAGGVRLFRRVVEVPVEDSVTLREERVRIDRVALDRPVTDTDRAFAPREIELTETAEEAVVGKEARVVEEVLVGKTTSERTETIRDTVRHTEVEVEELPGAVTERKTSLPGGTY